MSALAQSEATGTVLVAIPGSELRRQVTEFLAAQGYACVATPTVQAAFEIVDEFCADPDFVIADVRLPETRTTASAIVAARPAMKVLFLCSEPEFVAREFVTDPTVTFLEKPFAWCELKRVLSGYDAVPKAA